MATKFITIAIPAVGAGVQGPRVVVPTVGDDNKVKKVTGVKCSNTTKGMTLQLDSNSVNMEIIDLAVLGQLTRFAETDYSVDANIQLSFSINNTTGGALAAGDFLTLRYVV
jgi:hypothetical protein